MCLQSMYVIGVCLQSMYVIGVCLQSMYVIGVCLQSMHVIGVCLQSMYVIGVCLQSMHVIGVCLQSMYVNLHALCHNPNALSLHANSQSNHHCPWVHYAKTCPARVFTARKLVTHVCSLHENVSHTCVH